jgi:hypothetical protein
MERVDPKIAGAADGAGGVETVRSYFIRQGGRCAEDEAEEVGRWVVRGRASTCFSAFSLGARAV